MFNSITEQRKQSHFLFMEPREKTRKILEKTVQPEHMVSSEPSNRTSFTNLSTSTKLNNLHVEFADRSSNAIC